MEIIVSQIHKERYQHFALESLVFLSECGFKRTVFYIKLQSKGLNWIHKESQDLRRIYI